MKPEDNKETLPAVQKRMARSAIGAPDGGTAFSSSLKKTGNLCLGGVSHGRKLFTPLVKLLKSTTSAKDTAVLRAGTKGDSPFVKETPRFFFVAAGNNLCESLTGHIKNGMRRQNTLGRNSGSRKIPAKQSNLKRIQSLSAAYLLRKPGVTSVMRALSLYRQAGRKGELGPPKDAFKDAKAAWL